MKKAFLTGAIAAITIVSALSFSGTAAQAKQDQGGSSTSSQNNPGNSGNASQPTGSGGNSGQQGGNSGNPNPPVLLSCSTVANYLTPNLGCQVGNDNNDSLAEINAGNGFFKFKDWKLAGKDEETGTLKDKIGVDFTPGQSTSGTWDISALTQANPKWTNLMIVLKGSAPEPYVGWLLDRTITSGTWQSPFTNQKGDPQAVSHMSLYYRGESTAVPTPALLPGLVGMGVAALRKRKSNAEESTEA